MSYPDTTGVPSALMASAVASFTRVTSSAAALARLSTVAPSFAGGEIAGRFEACVSFELDTGRSSGKSRTARCYRTARAHGRGCARQKTNSVYMLACSREGRFECKRRKDPRTAHGRLRNPHAASGSRGSVDVDSVDASRARGARHQRADCGPNVFGQSRPRFDQREQFRGQCAAFCAASIKMCRFRRGITEGSIPRASTERIITILQRLARSGITCRSVCVCALFARLRATVVRGWMERRAVTLSVVWSGAGRGSVTWYSVRNVPPAFPPRAALP